jgi:hypothetical protein
MEEPVQLSLPPPLPPSVQSPLDQSRHTNYDAIVALSGIS